MDDAQWDSTDGKTGKDMSNNLEPDQRGGHLDNAHSGSADRGHPESCAEQETEEGHKHELNKGQGDGVSELVHDLLSNVVGDGRGKIPEQTKSGQLGSLIKLHDHAAERARVHTSAGSCRESR